VVADCGAGNGLAGHVSGIVRGAGFKNVKRAPLGARGVISWPVLGIVRAAASSAEAAIVSNSNGIVVVSVSGTAGGGSSRHRGALACSAVVERKRASLGLIHARAALRLTRSTGPYPHLSEHSR
jgi:hypothetical protein